MSVKIEPFEPHRKVLIKTSGNECFLLAKPPNTPPNTDKTAREPTPSPKGNKTTTNDTAALAILCVSGQRKSLGCLCLVFVSPRSETLKSSQTNEEHNTAAKIDIGFEQEPT